MERTIISTTRELDERSDLDPTPLNTAHFPLKLVLAHLGTRLPLRRLILRRERR